jgi:N-acetylneuraminic acid mutarotase
MKNQGNLSIQAHLLRGTFYLIVMSAGTLVAFLRAEVPVNVCHRTLTFEARVVYQRAIEEIYWRHRIWPEQRPEPKPSLDAVMSQVQIEKKVRDYLRNSQALEDYWQQPISAEQLQAEMGRMAHYTKRPEVLRELFEALGNDPFVIGECLARPVVAERTLADVESLKQALEIRLAKAEMGMPVAMTSVSANYTLPVIAPPSGGCTDDTWIPTSTANAPVGRTVQTTVWTGSEMIVWGGNNVDQSQFFNTGGRYDPSTDSWTATNLINAPDARSEHTAVWTGSEMIVWGGVAAGPSSLNTGGKYNPSIDSWTATSTTSAPDGRAGHTAVWTGSEMIVWGGGNGGGAFNTGGKYDPSTDSWIASSTTNAPTARGNHTAVWTGSEMIVWGGGNFNTGGRYNPSTDSWTATSTVNAPDGREFYTAVWTGSEMIIWGGNGSSGYLNSGARYTPGTDSWTATSTTNAPDGRYVHTAVWTGSQMIVWGGFNITNGYLNTGGRYGPDTDGWTATSITNAPDGRAGHSAVWSGSQMIVWGGSTSVNVFDTGGRYCAESGPTPTPSPTPTATATATPRPTPTPRTRPTAVPRP